MKNLKDSEFRNFIPYPAGGKYVAHKQPRFKHCCGALAADGSDPSATPAKIATSNVKMWGYAKTGLAIIGLYVAIKFVLDKVRK